MSIETKYLGKESIESPEGARFKIKELVTVAMSEQTKNKYSPFVSALAKKWLHSSSLFNAFDNSSLPRELYTQGVKAIFQKSNQETFMQEDTPAYRTQRLRGRLAGALFAHLAYGYLFAQEERAQKGNTVILGDGTLAVWRKLYPQAEEIIHPFGQSSLERTVPDGLLIDSTTDITSVIEVKLALKGKARSNLSKQIRSFSAGIEDYPHLYKDPTFILVTPTIESVPALVTDNSRINHIQLPFYSRDFREFSQEWFATYRPTMDTATLAEIWERELQEKQSIPYHASVLVDFGAIR